MGNSQPRCSVSHSLEMWVDVVPFDGVSGEGWNSAPSEEEGYIERVNFRINMGTGRDTEAVNEGVYAQVENVNLIMLPSSRNRVATYSIMDRQEG